MITITNRCVATKNKKSDLQCPYKKCKDSAEFCGVHMKSKSPRRYKLIPDPPSISHKTLQQKIYSIKEIFNCINIGYLAYPILKHTAESLNIPYNDRSKKELYYAILEQYKNDNPKYIQNIVKIQSLIRRYLVYRRKKCVNNEDFFTLDDKYEITEKYFFSYTDDNNFTYFFDIRSLIKLLETTKCNPYTNKPFSEKDIEKINRKIKYLRDKGIKLNVEKDKKTPEQEFNHFVIDVFHKFDLLDNYTDHNWFLNLSLSQLKKLYRIAEDIWNYRSELTNYQKSKIVSNGKAFIIPNYIVDNYGHMQKRKLQYIILNEFNRFVTEGTDINEKKLGAMLMLSALVETSNEAAEALPYLIQYF